MSADTLLACLDGVRQTGPGRWIARCPAHDDRSPSLSIRECGDGRVLVHDFAGCSVEEVLNAARLTFDALFPERPIADQLTGERRPFIPGDVLEIARLEVAVVAVLAADMCKKQEISETDYERLLAAARRLDDIAKVAYAGR